ncbi:uncharacterized protein LOC127793766 isoform X2 [Diospyros lotus]|uniref:uncharacterized protein LOC127793766 isoform X2 n=1 Tax=Diospyros lotus TaxID=55363 RepID=UPI00225158A7|nr:uncharacterized protein LOC127793766 isoform X2 [Diospyros lotus]
MEKKSWLCTLITQFFLFVALFVAINIGRPQKKPEYQISRDGRATFDLYFISVRGGSRSLQEQFRLLEQVENVLKTYKAKFVVDISELGEEDPLMQNATRYLQSLKVPWYTTNALKRRGADYFLKKVKIAEEKTLDLIALDTGSLKDPSSGTGRDQLHWLTRILETSNGNWHVVAGFHPMVACDKSIDQMVETKQDIASLHHIFLKYGVRNR